MNEMVRRFAALLMTLLMVAALPAEARSKKKKNNTPTPTAIVTRTPSPAPTTAPTAAPEAETITVTEDGEYTDREHVAAYLRAYHKLPSNYITKKDAERLGWSGGSLEPYAPGKCIGGSRFGNYEGLLPDAGGRSWTECDIDTLGAKSRGAKRIVFSNDGLIYYTDDHYEHFELLYGKED